MLMVGGRFAGVIAREGEVLAHRAFQRYVVRAKRGTVQSARDGKSGTSAPKSAGATLRRYGEAQLRSEVRELLNSSSSWQAHLQACELIFVRATVNTRAVLFGDRANGPGPLDRRDPRIRTVPFPGGRPTVREATRVYAKLSSVFRVGAAGGGAKGGGGGGGSEPKFIRDWRLAQEAAAKREEEEEEEEGCEGEKGGREGKAAGIEEVATPASAFRQREAEVDPDAYRDAPLYLAALKNDLPALTIALKTSVTVATAGDDSSGVSGGGGGGGSDGGSGGAGNFDRFDVIEAQGGSGVAAVQPDDKSAPPPPSVPNRDSSHIDYGWNDGGHTALHAAARCGHAEVVAALLAAGADPCPGNYRGQTAYVLAADKPTRNAFRRAMARHPRRWDWARAQVPSPLTPEMEATQAKKEADKKRKERERAKAKKKKKQAAAAAAAAAAEAEKQVQEDREREKERQPKLSKTASVREKMAAAALARRQAAKGSADADGTAAAAATAVATGGMTGEGFCGYCGRALKTDALKFHRLNYSYCRMPCLVRHKAALES